jgi:hypothetical protein
LPCGASAEVRSAGEVVVDLGSRELVEAEPLPAGSSKRGAGAERQLHTPLRLEATTAELAQRPVEVADPVQEYRRLAGEMVARTTRGPCRASATSAQERDANTMEG